MSERQFTMPSSPAGIPGFTQWERALSEEREHTVPPQRQDEGGGFGRAVVGAAIAFVLGLGVGTAVILGTGLAGPGGPGGPVAPAGPVVVAPAAGAPAVGGPAAGGPAGGPAAPAPGGPAAGPAGAPAVPAPPA